MRLQVMRSGAAALAMSLAIGAGAAVAQTQPKGPAPAAPGAPGQPQQPTLPSKVDLVSPEPQWAKFCAKEPNSGRDACATMRDFSTSADQPPMISINLFELAGEEKRKLRLLMLPIGMMLKPGFRVIIDKGEPIEGRYDMCFQNACSAEIEIGPKTLEALKKGTTMSVVMRVPGGDVSGHELTFTVPLKDLGAAFDGKPTDPKVLEQQRQELQQQLQKKAEEQRKMLEQQQRITLRPRRRTQRLQLRRPPRPPPRRPLRRSSSSRQASRGRREALFQLRCDRPRTQYRPSSVRSKVSLTCGWLTGSPDSSDSRFCSET